VQKITPFLWYDDKAEDAMHFYVGIFKNSKVIGVSRYGDAGPGPKGTVMTAEFELDGQRFTALNGGPHFKFNESVSFVVHCDTQQEIDYFWEKLSAGGGKTSQCGWLKDKYGLSWQVAPSFLDDMVKDTDPTKADRVIKALLPMTKLDVAALRAAYEGR